MTAESDMGVAGKVELIIFFQMQFSSKHPYFFHSLNFPGCQNKSLRCFANLFPPLPHIYISLT